MVRGVCLHLLSFLLIVFLACRYCLTGQTGMPVRCPAGRRLFCIELVSYLRGCFQTKFETDFALSGKQIYILFRSP
jgi:hypothetical protein